MSIVEKSRNTTFTISKMSAIKINKDRKKKWTTWVFVAVAKKNSAVGNENSLTPKLWVMEFGPVLRKY